MGAMVRLKILLSSVFVAGMLFAGSAQPDSRTEFDHLESVYSLEQVHDLRLELETCINQLGLATEMSVTIDEQGSTASVRIDNSSNMTISGIVIESDDPLSSALGLSGKSTVKFDLLKPGEISSVSEIAFGFYPPVDNGDSAGFEIRVVDILDADGLEIISHIFDSRWPLISSGSELKTALSNLCDYSI